MNLLLLHSCEITKNGVLHFAEITGRRADHIINILKLEAGDTVRIGIVNGKTGLASIDKIHHSTVIIKFDLSLLQQSPPNPSNLKFIFALPRPLVASRLIKTASECGIKSLHFIHSSKVEKSYWQSPQLEPEKIQEQILLGLEQAKDTTLPEIHFHKKFKPFVEDKLAELINDNQCYVCHPGHNHLNSITVNKKDLWFVIGPEGGFTDFEITLLENHACKQLNLGERIYRTETMLPFITGRFS